jgi:tRNA 5-methylaminomethyl-2-thiouridine biosynthesis bifunctional protein
MSPDRLPIVGPVVGPVSASDGLWILNGLGARGLVWASLCAELLASQVAGDPLPVEADLVGALALSRFGDRRGRSGTV